MEIKINDLPELLIDLINKSGKTKQKIQEDVGLSNSTLSRLCNRRHGMQKSTAKVLNDYFEVPYFTSYRIINGTCIHSDVIVPNYKGNKFNPGDTIMNLFNRKTFMVTEIKFNKTKQEWMYLLDNQWVEEFYIKGINLETKPIKKESDLKDLENLDEIIDRVLLGKEPIDTPNEDAISYTPEDTMIHSDEFVIPQFEVKPEESIKESIEKLDDKDSIKNILKDVVTRLINLL